MPIALLMVVRIAGLVGYGPMKFGSEIFWVGGYRGLAQFPYGAPLSVKTLQKAKVV